MTFLLFLFTFIVHAIVGPKPSVLSITLIEVIKVKHQPDKHLKKETFEFKIKFAEKHQC